MTPYHFLISDVVLVVAQNQYWVLDWCHIWCLFMTYSSLICALYVIRK